MKRRTFIGTTTAAAAALPGGLFHAAPGLAARGKPGFKAVSSANGIQAVAKAVEKMQAGEDTLDAAIAGVNIVEDDPNDFSVGLGGLPNEDGVVELDAAVMHGPRHLAGAVASLRNIRNPSKVAKMVLEQTDHVLIAGKGALTFAKRMGFEEENLLTERARKIWLYWKQTLSDRDDWIPRHPTRLRRIFATWWSGLPARSTWALSTRRRNLLRHHDQRPFHETARTGWRQPDHWRGPLL